MLAFSAVVAENTVVLPEVMAYRPGEFYRRELPPLRAVLRGVAGLDLLIVDSYADLDPSGRPGLGAHAHAEFGVPVIGVAKSAFAAATHAIPVLRGPLICHLRRLPTDAADLVRRMAGRFRYPTPCAVSKRWRGPASKQTPASAAVRQTQRDSRRV
jgi:deoxyribonuclease V